LELFQGVFGGFTAGWRIWHQIATYEVFLDFLQSIVDFSIPSWMLFGYSRLLPN
jgi:hypothetical protein